MFLGTPMSSALMSPQGPLGARTRILWLHVPSGLLDKTQVRLLVVFKCQVIGSLGQVSCPIAPYLLEANAQAYS